MELLEKQELEKIRITAICQAAGVNRTTFYANYLDVYDLVDAVGKKLEGEVRELYRTEGGQKGGVDFLRLFYHIRENQLFYKTYFKLGLESQLDVEEYGQALEERFGGEYLDYRISFFRGGLNAIVKRWLAEGCRETPEELCQIIRWEYRGREKDEELMFSSLTNML